MWSLDRSMNRVFLVCFLDQHFVKSLSHILFEKNEKEYSNALAFVTLLLFGFATVYPVIYCRKQFDVIITSHFIR